MQNFFIVQLNNFEKNFSITLDYFSQQKHLNKKLSQYMLSRRIYHDVNAIYHDVNVISSYYPAPMGASFLLEHLLYVLWSCLWQTHHIYLMLLLQWLIIC